MENQNYLPPSISNAIPAMVRNELLKLPALKQEEFVQEFRRKSYSKGLAYLFWFLFGAHYAYMGKWGIQVLFWITAGGFFFWWLIDLFRLGGVVANHNKDVATDVMRNLKIMSL